MQNNIAETLKKLGPKELETATKVIFNIHSYSQMYDYVTNYILMTYPDIDAEKSSKISGDIDGNLADLGLGYGERLFIYNTLNRPFVIDFFKKELKEEKYIKRIFFDDINDMILAVHPDLNVKHMENLVRETEEKLKNLKYEERWIIYNALGYTLIQDLISNLEEI